MNKYVAPSLTEINFQISGNKKNIKVINSYLVKNKKDKECFIKYIKDELQLLPSRSELSLFREWESHNILYGWNVAPNRTRDTDLNDDESLIRRIGYFFISLIFNEK